jgi:hypothetical protein
MALKVANRVQETTATTGTGTITLAGAVSGFQPFSAVASNGDFVYYTITSGTDWEVGYGTYATAGNTLARTVIFSSSAAGAAITLVGTSTVFLDYPAERAVYLNEFGNSCTIPGTLSIGAITATAITTSSGNNSFTGTSTLTGGTGCVLTVNSNSFTLTTTGAGTIGIGGTAATGQVSVGRSTKAQTVVIGSGVTETGLTAAFQIGVNGGAGSTTNITIGSTAGTSTTTMQGNTRTPAGTTAMTSGFFYIPAAAGAPSGVPTALSGTVPMYYDTTNNRFYIYNGAWKMVTLI